VRGLQRSSSPSRSRSNSPSARANLERFVYAYIIYGRKIGLVDAAYPSFGVIADARETNGGVIPRDSNRLVLTHAHPDPHGRGPDSAKEPAASSPMPWTNLDRDVDLNTGKGPS